MAKKKRPTGTAIAGLAFGIALGTAFGTYVLSPNLPGGANEESHKAVAELAEAKSEAAINDAQASAADSYIAATAGDTVSNALKDRPVLIFRTADANEDDVKAVTELRTKSGAKDAGTITLTEKFFSMDGADPLKSIVANTLPAGAQLSTTQLDPGTHAGEALGAALLLNKDNGEPLASTEDRALLLKALRDGGYINYPDGTVLPAQLVIVITGDSDGVGDKNFAAVHQATFAKALDKKANGVVVAGRVNTAAENGVIGQLRKDAQSGVSTVDSVDRAFGQIATILAGREQLENKQGDYGTANDVDAVSPGKPKD
ncbi:Copper transporter MctB precursor [Corynebacterium kalinowskii]|uniref:Copper transporter MctB n=1 Tax=Corynebacterium kalinowskii TaxID=2675216 RepID=A0A6B8VQT6_9CORY|nr:copper transporter [Corynebacterium kalinowskii]QGU01927.1 Copper transporter MctB precursor [Corynebacterium kalinowskii]